MPFSLFYRISLILNSKNHVLNGSKRAILRLSNDQNLITFRKFSKNTFFVNRESIIINQTNLFFEKKITAQPYISLLKDFGDVYI